MTTALALAFLAAAAWILLDIAAMLATPEPLPTRSRPTRSARAELAARPWSPRADHARDRAEILLRNRGRLDFPAPRPYLVPVPPLVMLPVRYRERRAAA